MIMGRRRKKNHFRLYLTLALLLALAVYVYRAFYSSAFDADTPLYIHTGEPYSQSKSTIQSSMHYAWAFDVYARRLDLEHRIKPGYYLVSEGTTVISLVRRLCLGDQTPISLSVKKVRTTARLAKLLSSQIEADSSAVDAALRNRSKVSMAKFGCDSIFAMFIPNTYSVFWNISPDELISRLAREADRFWDGKRTEKLKKLGMSRLQATVLASIVNEETALTEDMPTVAGVYMNRLRRHMKLQACPTAKYALQQFDLKRVLVKHTRFQSPYNTYVTPGLPPSPICMPEIRAIDAVLDYEHNTYLFFCADPAMNGKTIFASTYSEHSRNAKRWAKKLDELNIK